MSVDPPLPDNKREVRRTIPQLRDTIRAYMRGKLGDTIDDDFILEVDLLLEETKRRSPKWKVARKKQPDPDPETILAIRKYKTENENAHSRDMSILFKTSTRCISFALVGKRDGSPVFDDTGKRIQRAGRGSAPDDDERPMPPGDWE